MTNTVPGRMVPIIVVDDSAADLQLAAREFLRARVINPIRLFPSAEACLEYFRTTVRPGDFCPCIVVVDLVLTPSSGVDLLRDLQRLPAARGSVLMMLSGLADSKMIAEGYAAGASTFIMKPVSHEELLRIFRKVPGLKVQERGKGFVLGINSRAMNSIDETSRFQKGSVLGVAASESATAEIGRRESF